MKRRWLQIPLHLIFAGAIVLAALVVLTQTALFRNWLRQFVVTQASRSLQGDLHIEQLRGNILTGLELHGVLLTHTGETDTVLYVPALRLAYSPLRLLQRRIAIDSIRIEAPEVRLRQMRDGTWNLADLFKNDSTATPDTTATAESGGGFPFTVTLGDLQLRNARLRIAALDTIWPRQIRDINLQLGGMFSATRQELRVTEFRLRAEEPDFILQQLTFDLRRDAQEIRLRNFTLRTANNGIAAHAAYADADQPRASGRLDARPLALSEFKVFLPALDLPGSPDLAFRFSLRNDVLRAQIDVQDDAGQHLNLQADVVHFSTILRTSKKQVPRYTVLGQMQGLQLGRWLDLPETDYLLNGRFRLAGTGFKPQRAKANLDAEFIRSIILQQPVDTLQVQAQYNRGDLEATIRGISPLTDISAEAKVQDLFGVPQYTLRAWLNGLNLARAFRDSTFASALDLHRAANGTGFDPEKMYGNVRLDMLPGSILQTRIDTLHFASRFDAGKARGLALHLASAPIRLDLSGSAGLDKAVNLRYQAQFRNLMPLRTFLGVDTLHAAGSIAGTARGRVDSLFIDSSLQMRDLLYGSHAADSLAAQVQAHLNSGRPSGNGTLLLTGARSSGIAFDTLALDADFTPEQVNLSLDAARLDFAVHLRAETALDSTIKIILPEIVVTLKNRRWQGGNADMWVEIDNSSYRVHNFRLAAANDTTSHPAQLYVDGTVSPSGDENLLVRISELDLRAIAALVQMPVRLDGLFSMDIRVEGHAQHPVIRSRATIANGHINDFLFNSFAGDLRYEDGTFFLDYALVPGETDSLSIRGSIPMPIFGEDTTAAPRNMQVKIKAEAMPLGLLMTAVPDIQDVRGTFSCNLDVRNSLADPRPYGFLRIDQGAFKIPELGVDYTDLQVQLTADSNRLTLEKLAARRGPGFLRASGYVNLDSSVVAGVVRSVEVDLVADQFYVAQHKDFEIEIAADAFLRGDAGLPQFGGEVKVTHAIFNIPALMKRTEKQPERDYAVPILVRAARQIAPERWGGEPENKVDSENPELSTPTPPGFMKNLHGSLKLTIPRDTWLKAQNMSIEIEGNLDLVKKEDDFELFGTIAIVRGFYSLYGRQFKVVEGQLSFQGGEKLNPTIMLQAEYNFRDSAKERRTLLLLVRGDMLQPKVKFTLDEKDIDESDAVAYIVFGRSMDELTYGEKSDVTQGNTIGNQVLMDVASSLLTNQLANSLGREFKLDLIEVRAQDNWQSATFVIGKYLTNELFVSYQRTFGESQDNDIVPQTIIVEYELTRYLFLQAIEGDSKTSGVDLILKFQRE